MTIETLGNDLGAADESGFFEDIPGARLTAQDLVYRKISHLLSCGAFQPGAKLSLRQLSAAFGVSETPVRAALARLVAEGAIDVLPNRYFVIPRLTRAEVAELMQLRLQLETDIMHHAYLNVSRQDLRELERLSAAFIALCDPPSPLQVLSTNQRFHFRLYSGARRPMTFSLIRNLWMRAGSVLGMTHSAGAGGWSEPPHANILRGLRIRDEKLCLEAISRDIRRAAAAIDSLLIDEKSGPR